jgi:hypothetical protein
MNNIICKYCNKLFKSYQSRSNHYKRIHILTNSRNTAIVPPNEHKVNLLTDKKPPNNYSCEYCNNKFTRNDSLKKHYSRCKLKNSTLNILKEKNDLLEKKIIQQSEQMDQIKTLLTDILNKNCKVHPKTLNKINKQLNISDNGIVNENTNNGIINNNITYNIIGLGHENLTEVFTKKEKMAILKNRYYSLHHLVEYAHFNDKYPQFKNILITNTQNNLAYKYDTRKKQFIAVNKDELLDDIVDERMCDINSFYEELEEELDERTKEILDKVKDKIDNDPAYKEIKKKDIKLIIYNNRKKVNKELAKKLEIEV